VVTPRWTVGPVLYGAAWVVLAPALLLWWAAATADEVPLPALHSLPAGAIVAGAGLVLILRGMLDLRVRGGGLPMNAYPPPRYVAAGVYRWIAHPIYVGATAVVAGTATATGSASGLWLVTPVTALALAALVLGYERHDLRRRFGEGVHRPLLALPRAGDGPAERWERLSVYLLVLLPWLLVYEAVHQLGVPADALPSHLPFERDLPVVEWTEAVYASAYVLVLATPLLLRSRPALRRFAVLGLLSTVTVTLIYLTVPLVAPPRPFDPSSALGRLLAFERTLGHTVAAFPAFHVLWPLIAAEALRSRGRLWSAAAYAWAVLIAASCITTGMHSLADVVFAAILFLPLRRYEALWSGLRRASERMANSWKEWRIGPVRVINHGFYAGAGGAAGVWIAGWLTGPDWLLPVVAVGVLALLASALWAQLVEGSPRLLRPLGYYGGILGGLATVAVLALQGRDVVLLLGALAVAMPCVQAAGRLRCLVQGCCHGGPAPAAVGIRYLHTRSRVTQISELAGVPLHPTPLYSILSNLVAGGLLFRLWILGASPALVLGLYFIFNALTRFVEEAYRAEPQTPVVARLRMYQWLALAGFVGGIAFTALPASPAPPPSGAGDPWLLAGALLVGVVGWFVTGVDFPASNRRFSRLAPAEGPAELLQFIVPVPPAAVICAAAPSPPGGGSVPGQAIATPQTDAAAPRDRAP
jgi:protein-S-isoprenylcysteine O-methyltransferase Ste14